MPFLGLRVIHYLFLWDKVVFETNVDLVVVLVTFFTETKQLKHNVKGEKVYLTHRGFGL